MAKSKKGQRSAKVAGARSAATAGRAKAAARRTKPAGAKAVRGVKSRAGVAKGATKRPGGGRAAVAKGVKAPPAAPAFAIRELDPLRICGGATSVVQLFRADEVPAASTAAKGRQIHLVFNDRHGWYCEHGRSCHAVSAVMRHAGIR